MSTKRKLSGLLAIAVLLLVSTTAAFASGFLNVLNPETAKGPAIVPPLLAPPGQAGYANQPAGEGIIAPDHRPVAQLLAPPADLSQSLAVNFPNGPSEASSAMISYSILASVRYGGNGHTLLVTTARPSRAAAQQPTVLGNQTIKLPEGTTAWVTTGIPGDTPNQVVFLRNDLIITVAGDLPVSSLAEFAEQVIVE